MNSALYFSILIKMFVAHFKMCAALFKNSKNKNKPDLYKNINIKKLINPKKKKKKKKL